MLERLSYSSKNDESIGGVPSSLVGFVAYIARYGEAFHELYRLGRIAMALPVSTASCERSFSALTNKNMGAKHNVRQQTMQCCSAA